MSYSVLPVSWESEFFAFPIGRLELPADYSPEQLEETLKLNRNQFRLVCISLDQNGPDSITANDAECICFDRRLRLTKNVPDNVSSLDKHVRAYTSTFCSKWLEQLAVQSGQLSRFKRDPELSSHFERLFLTWINYSVSGEFADSIWTWREGNRHVGLVTIRCIRRQINEHGDVERDGCIELLAVDRQFRRHGIGTHLFEACDFWCSSLAMKNVTLTTQLENEQTIRLCEKIGYKRAGESTVYHYWSPGWVYDTRHGWISRVYG
ncbi:MAG: GNAT family N-acetyltransferase [Planctomycetaceae bacterium]|jgi:dTDP-4-amino-4,6-dideoxy-D-galactose acyltransferase|nr:GNAT family N-acetyltransferase [Planctomycetaceae bacterium]